MRNWTYSEHDGKHIINDDRGVLVAIVVDAKTAELIIRQHEELAEKERIINLPDGLEPMSDDDLQTIWNKADNARGEQAHLSDDVFDVVNALEAAYAKIDSLRKQTEEYGMTIERQGKEMIRVQGLVNKHLQEVEHLREQLAEKDGTISHIKESKRLLLLVHDEEFARSSEYVQENSKLRKALKTATDALNGITNGEWSETIDDQFLEVWTTRRINPSRIADEALLEISRELDALGKE